MLMELFCDWFVGSFNNRSQAYGDPRSARYVIVQHEKTGVNEFYCAYTYHRSKTPYRELLLRASYENGDIHLTDLNSRATMVFKHEGSTFNCSVEHRKDDKLYIYEAILGEGYYYVNDQCYDKDGNLVRGLPNENWFEFKKIV